MDGEYMTEIAKRRRAIMCEQEKSDPTILWQTKNQTVTGGFVSTGVPLCSVDQDWTIAYDITINSIADSGDSSTPLFFRILPNSGSAYALAAQRLGSGGAFRMSLVYMGGSKKQLSTNKVTAGRYKIICYHEKSSGSIVCYYKEKSSAVVNQTITGTFAASSKNLVLGQSSGENQLPDATLNKVVVYSRVLSATEINSFMGVS